MRIVALVKQVPGTSEVSVDPERGTLRREGVPAKINPYDLHALEAALQLRDRLSDGLRDRRGAIDAAVATVTVISMGPPQAEAVIRESYWMGADDGILLTDRVFAGADTLATSFALSQAAKRVGFDLIIAGMQSTDGDTAQVGPGVAEFLGIPHVSYVRSIEFFPIQATRIQCGRRADAASPRSVVVTADLGDRYLTQDVSLPCLLTVTRDINQPRLPSFRMRRETAGKAVGILKPSDLPASSESYYGLSGSPTRVERIFPPGRERTHEVWEGAAGDLARRLAVLLKEVLVE